MKMKEKTVYPRKEKYLTTYQALARRDMKLFCEKGNDKSRHCIIHYQGDSSQNFAMKGWPEMNSCSKERNPDQK